MIDKDVIIIDRQGEFCNRVTFPFLTKEQWSSFVKFIEENEGRFKVFHCVKEVK
jgi:hypothetical protein